jgi:hypothetical protein
MIEPTSWARSSDGRTLHALEDRTAERKRSLCGLRIIAEASEIVTGEIHVVGIHVCRSCLEKLGADTARSGGPK